ncbi:ABC transporter permease [Marinimicrobium sp. ABcell2]|uniref:ABC transporter permease n=1 Tax=Marinimicrobium sp. ABcell2 TaxID=3069751 RepID=UPI0027B26D30|nr:ABC transporter permease [Marinimicrobium sp. ABcell2]MDQ2078337.1 ABC transporter permease [Marinimicrobium sp. ABcell2]
MKPLQFISLLDIKARMGLKSEASKLYLSYLWWVLEPILWALAFFFVFEILLAFGRDLFFILCGKVPFLWFSKSVTNGSGSIVSGKSLINQTNVPKHFFPYETVQGILYKQWLVFLVLLGLAVIFGYAPTWHWLWLIPLIIVQYLVILAVTLLGALLVSYVRDVRILINMSMLFLMFTSGIFWDLSRISDPIKRDLLITWNPLAYLIDAYRKVIMYNTMYDVSHLLAVAGVFFGAIVLLHVIYHYKGQAIASRVINS